MQEITKEDFDAHAPRTVADFFTQLPYSFNTTFTVGRALGSSNGSGSLNLRNLGADATLVLLNSRRVARDAVTVNNVDVNSLVPQIAIQRIDILKDGASSLYGSDAVGGVANFLTRGNFDGFEVQAMGDMRAYGNTTDMRFSGIWGTQTENSGIVVSFEYFNRAPFTWETYEIIRERPGIEGAFRLSGWPARYSLPNRNAAGALLTGAAGATTIADPMCARLRAFRQHDGQPGDAPRRHLPRQLPAERPARHQCQRRRGPLPGLHRGAQGLQRVAALLRRGRLPAHAHCDSPTLRAVPRIRVPASRR